MAEQIDKCQEPDDPRRCQAVVANGQCHNISVEGGSTCRIHGGNMVQLNLAKQAANNYRLDKFKARIDRLSTNPQIKSIREEIAILRMLVEERLNKCVNENDLIIYSQQISDLVMKVQMVVTNCHKLESNLRVSMDKQAVLQFASEVVEIVGSELSGIEGAEAIVEKIADRIIQSMAKKEEEENDADI